MHKIEGFYKQALMPEIVGKMVHRFQRVYTTMHRPDVAIIYEEKEHKPVRGFEVHSSPPKCTKIGYFLRVVKGQKISCSDPLVLH